MSTLRDAIEETVREVMPMYDWTTQNALGVIYQIEQSARVWFAASSPSPAEIERSEGTLIDQRDNAEDWADRLAYAIAPVEVIGEHSSSNNPWWNALALLAGRSVHTQEDRT